MRRPLKPFVTEYKQSPRRNQSSQSEQNGFDGERASPRPFDMSLAEPDDSYDAAMRAADALFSIPAPPPVTPAARSAPAPDHGANIERTPVADKPMGRILRVIDEAPDPQIAALEAERAPKRRGRKPGSKNKAKAPLAIEAIHSASPPRPVAPAAAVEIVAPVPAARRVAALSAIPVGEPRGDKRFAWVRDRLRPGEDWKRRRLPRVCW